MYWGTITGATMAIVGPLTSITILEWWHKRSIMCPADMVAIMQTCLLMGVSSGVAWDICSYFHS